MKSISNSVRYKLLMLVLIPILVILPLVLGVTMYWFHDQTYKQLYAKVSSDLAVANDVFFRLQKDYLGQLEKLVESHSFQLAYWENDQARIEDQIALMHATTDFDFLRIVRIDSEEFASTESEFLENALRLAKPDVGIQLYYQTEFEDSNPGIADRMWLPLINTPKAAETSRTAENRGMFIRALYPIRNEFDEAVAILDGGVLLNGNFSFVDEIRDLVYGEGTLPDNGWGTVTVFLDDVRISTNVPLREGERALGTRVSSEVRDHVLGDGKKWIDRAFVVHDWYISAYEPILDIRGEKVGMLYTGYLESPYTEAYTRAVTALVVIIVFTGVIVGFFVARGAKGIFGPIERMTYVARATQKGDDIRIGGVRSDTEIGELATQFDAMLDLLKERTAQVEQASRELENEVEARTRELKNKNFRLQETVDLLRETQQQLSLAGKLAALGQLTAGVAHEINNPTAVILGNMDILVKELGEDSSSVQTEIDLIIEQVYRIRAIVDKLLQYSRTREISTAVEAVDVNQLMHETLDLVHHELSAKAIEVNKVLLAESKAYINSHELQQVLINLLMNAVQALPYGGSLDYSSADSRGGVEIRIKDYGEGISKSDLPHVFDPFFSNKSEGTGLGLSVSHSLIQRYGGDIEVKSQQGEWTEFIVILRTETRASETKEMIEVYG